MCGRFANIEKWGRLKAYYDAYGEIDEWRENYNLAPTQKAPVIVETGKGRELRLMKWGLLQSWDKEAKKPTFNARSETIREQAFFKESFYERRCIVPVTGFYEWKVVNKDKKKERYPTYFTPKEGLFSFCGIWKEWESPEGKKVETFSIITTTANAIVGKIHDRMPVAITGNMIGAWLAADAKSDVLKSFLTPFPASQMKGIEVSRYVNSFKNHGAICIEPLGGMG
jgi:putative SOS response-associated peptidase YedK